MRLNIGICDDFPEQVALLSAYLNRRHDSGAFQIVTGTEPLRFLEDLENTPPQLVFLDIDMGETSGIRLGEAIKSRYPDTLIIYITAYSKYACDAFGVRAFHYLLKPLTEETLSQVLTEALDYIEKRRNGIPVKTLTIRNKGETVSLRYDNIYYFEKAGHRISVHTTAGDYNFYGKFVALLAEIDPGCFVQCHQGYVANIGKIRAFRDKTLFLEGDISLPVSRSYTDTVKNILAERLFAGKDSR